MEFNSKNLLNLNFQVDEIAIDTSANTLILFNSSNTITYELNSKSIISQSSNLPHDLISSPASSEILQSSASNHNISSSLNIAQPTNIISLNHTNLKFFPSQAQSRLVISPSGLLITCQSKEEEIAIANQGFDTGVHYWEWIFPKSCMNIQVGVIKKGWSLTNITVNNKLSELYQLKTTTPRVFGFRLDLNKGEIKCWLNGIFQPQRTKKIEKGIWYPCVKLKDIGTHIILNPYAVDPEMPEITYVNN